MHTVVVQAYKHLAHKITYCMVGALCMHSSAPIATHSLAGVVHMTVFSIAQKTYHFVDFWI